MEGLGVMIEKQNDRLIHQLADIINKNAQREFAKMEREIDVLRTQVGKLQVELDHCVNEVATLQTQCVDLQQALDEALQTGKGQLTASDSVSAPDPALAETKTPNPEASPEKSSEAKNGYVAMGAMVSEYNRVVDQPQLENTFRDKYGPERLEVENFVDRKLNPELPPVFIKGGGDYWVIATKTPDHYIVLPRFTMVYDEDVHEASAMGQVFVVNGYRPGRRFTKIRLIKPAIFTYTEDVWKPTEQGELQLEI